MEAFENVLYSYIISIIESEFFGNGIFLEKGTPVTPLALLPLSILMLSQTLTKSIHVNLSQSVQSGQTSALASLSIRCNFHLFPDLSSWNQPLSRGQTKLSFSREQVSPSEKIFHLSISPQIVIISIKTYNPYKIIKKGEEQPIRLLNPIRLRRRDRKSGRNCRSFQQQRQPDRFCRYAWT